jgi:hypothetical protein
MPVEALDLGRDNPGPLAEPEAWIRDDGRSRAAGRLETPDNRNDQARAHPQAGESAEEGIVIPEVKCGLKTAAAVTGCDHEQIKIGLTGGL